MKEEDMPFCFKLPKEEGVSFPNECFICGSHSTGTFTMRRFSLMPRIVTYRFTRLSISVPVCGRHSSVLNACRYSFWFLVALVAALAVAGYTKLAVVGAFIAVSVVLLSFKLTRRFFIFEHDDDSITYASHDDDYLIKLCNLNKATVFKRSYLI